MPTAERKLSLIKHLDCITVFTVFSCKANLADTQVFLVCKSHEAFSVVQTRITDAKILKRKKQFHTVTQLKHNDF